MSDNYYLIYFQNSSFGFLGPFSVPAWQSVQIPKAAPFPICLGRYSTISPQTMHSYLAAVGTLSPTLNIFSVAFFSANDGFVKLNILPTKRLKTVQNDNFKKLLLETVMFSTPWFYDLGRTRGFRLVFPPCNHIQPVWQRI